MWRQVSFTLSLLVNLLPGLTMELMERKLFRRGGTFIDAWHPHTCQRGDREMHSCGFEFLGHLLCRHMPGWVLRCYRHPQKQAWGVQYVGLVVGNSFDVVTRFSDGTWLTSTTSPLSGARIGQTVMARPNADFLTLADLHFERTNSRDCSLAQGGLDGIIAAMEQFFSETREPLSVELRGPGPEGPTAQTPYSDRSRRPADERSQNPLSDGC